MFAARSLELLRFRQAVISAVRVPRVVGDTASREWLPRGLEGIRADEKRKFGSSWLKRRKLIGNAGSI